MRKYLWSVLAVGAGAAILGIPVECCRRVFGRRGNWNTRTSRSAYSTTVVAGGGSSFIAARALRMRR
jgi:hypothetical protein